MVKTGLQIAIPAGTYARVAPRSGLAVKHFIDTGAGVVDEDYRGEVGVVLFNHADTPFQGEARCCLAALLLQPLTLPAAAWLRVPAGCRRLSSLGRTTSSCCPPPPLPLHTPFQLPAAAPAVKRGDRIAQLILERIATPEVCEVDSLDETQRGAGGYGSTGVAS